eukprot:2567793-Rhodomonas_salina.1
MSYFGWKNNPIERLYAKDDPSLPATESDFIKWKDGAQRSKAAVQVGAGYITCMITFFENDATLIPTFSNVGVPVDANGKADDNLTSFNHAVIALASLCGKNFQPLDYLNVDADLWKAIASLRLDLSSFGLQIKNACKAHHSDAFSANDVSITTHPLREIIKWNLLEISFNPFKTSSAGNDWVELQEAIMIDLSLDFDSLTAHMARVSLLCNKSVSGSSEQDIYSKILGTLIKKLQEAEGYESLRTVRIWRAVSTQWYTDSDHQKDPSSVPWNVLKLTVSKELLCFKGSESFSNSKRPKLNTSVPPGVAFPAFSAKEMYDVAMQAITNQCAARTSGSECWNCGQIGHQNRNCPHPIQQPQTSRFRQGVGGA